MEIENVRVLQDLIYARKNGIRPISTLSALEINVAGTGQEDRPRKGLKGDMRRPSLFTHKFSIGVAAFEGLDYITYFHHCRGFRSRRHDDDLVSDLDKVFKLNSEKGRIQ